MKSTTTSASPSTSASSTPSAGSALRQLHVLGALDRLADRLAHPPGGTGDDDADHAATSASLPGPEPPEALLAAADAGGREPLGAVELGRQRGQLVDRDGVDLGQHLVEAVDRQVEEGRAGDPRHPRRRRLRGEDEAALDVLLRPRQLRARDRLAAQPLELGADDRAGLLDVVLAGPDVGRDEAGVGVLLVVGADRVGEAALLAHLSEQARGGRAAEDRVEHRERVAPLVVAGDAGSAEADVVLLGVLLVEAQPRRVLGRSPPPTRSRPLPAARPGARRARRCARGRGARRRRRRRWRRCSAARW